MKLTKLELSGFKSFADTVTLTFEEGVTAIVGPNGCGKSNVSDAVRWVLGEQSARLLRGGKMEDVIFQGSAARRPVNVTEVSLFLDNSDGDLPIAYREVVVTRRLSRSGQSDYLLNGAPVRLRDIQDLLRGTGLGSDAGVVIEAKMIDLLLSDRADERRSLFEEAAGIGLYRDRKHSTERRLEETAVDLQRVEDLIAEVQSQIRSLARQRGKAERHAKLTEERFAVQLTLARRLLERLSADVAGMEARFAELSYLLPAARTRVTEAEHRREETARARAAAEAQRTDIASRLATVRVELGKLDGDLALADERLANAHTRRTRAEDERSQALLRAQQATAEQESATADRGAAGGEHERIRSELAGRASAEEDVRRRLTEQRDGVRRREQELQQQAQTLRSLEGERTALEGELASLRERVTQAAAHRATLQIELAAAERRRDQAIERAGYHEPRGQARRRRGRARPSSRGGDARARGDAPRRPPPGRRGAGPDDRETERPRGAGARSRRPRPRRGRAAGRPGPVQRRRAGSAQRLRDHRPGGRRAGGAAARQLDARRGGAGCGDGARGAGVAFDHPARRGHPAATGSGSSDRRQRDGHAREAPGGSPGRQLGARRAGGLRGRGRHGPRTPPGQRRDLPQRHRHPVGPAAPARGAGIARARHRARRPAP